MSGGTAKERAVAELLYEVCKAGSDMGCVDLANAAYDAGREQGIEEAAGVAQKYKTSVDASVDCSDGRRRQIIEFDGREISRLIRKLKDGKG